jgi:uncharacterized protein with HEPN domain
MTRQQEHLEDLLTEIHMLEAFTESGEEAFYADDRTQYAVMMAYARIGEIAKRLPEALVAKHPEAEWRDVKGFRDVLLHRYDQISPQIVWGAVKKLPVLKAAVEAMLRDLETDAGDKATE